MDGNGHVISGDERRQYKRMAGNVQVNCALLEKDTETWAAAARDASMGGIALDCARPLFPGTRLALEFEVQKNGEPFRIKAQGLVRWSRVGQPPIQVGVQFTSLEGAGQDVLENWLDMLVDEV